jgi:hypothetical protein
VDRDFCGVPPQGEPTKVDSQDKRQAGLGKAEEMFVQYIQQRKAALAKLALDTLVELEPNHPRRKEFEIWLQDLEEEVELKGKIGEVLEAGRAALQRGDLAEARKRREQLRKLDSWAEEGESFEAEIAAHEHDAAESADIERLKKSFEELLAARRFDEAEKLLAQLSALDLPKVSLDFLRKHLDENRGIAADEAEAASIVGRFQSKLADRHWQEAREIAHAYGERFPASPRAAELFNQVNEMEAAERRLLSLQEGIQTFERFLAEGKKQEAGLALRLLESLELDKGRLESLAAKLREL